MSSDLKKQRSAPLQVTARSTDISDEGSDRHQDNFEVDPAIDPDTAYLGQVIDGRYRIIEVVGRGGMGSVFKAEHIAIRRTVAVKLLHPTLAQVPEVSRRFEREAFAIGRIGHPNCVNVSDFGNLPDGSLYLVMEYLKGRALSDELAQIGRMPPLRALLILRHILRGLGHAHANGIVHRDVKPENIILITNEDDPDFAKILDFGIAKLLGEAAVDGGHERLTQAGMAFGTPIYMSPEQALGQTIDGRADLYAATIMAYEMIAGRPPFQAEDKIEVMAMHTARPVPPFSETAPELEVPESVEHLLLRGLSKRPGDRFADAGDYVAELDEVLRDISGGAIELPQSGSFHVSGRLSTNPHSHRTQSTGMQVLRPNTISSGPQASVQASKRRSTTHSQSLSPIPGDVMNLPPPPQSQMPRAGKRRWWLVIAGSLAIVTAVAVAVVDARNGGDGDGNERGDQSWLAASERPSSPNATDSSPSASRSQAAAMTLAEQAADMLSRGIPEEVIKLLEDHKEQLRQDPMAQLQLGYAYAAMRANSDALRAFRNALVLDDALQSDPKLRASLQAIANDQDSVLSVEAAVLMIEHQIGDEPETALLALTASRASKVRQKAQKAIETSNLSDRVDWTRFYILDLKQQRSCEERRQAVASLRALGDPRAIEALKDARYRRRSRSSKRNANRCLREDAIEAIQYLESLQATKSDTSNAPAKPSEMTTAASGG